MLTKMDHIGVAVADMDAGLGKWRDLLGLDLRVIETLPVMGVRIAFLEQREGPTIELVSPLGEDSPVRRFIDKRGEGIHHLCFQVDDIGKSITELRSRGVEFVDEEPRAGGEGALTAFILPKNFNGVLIELKQKYS